MAISVQNLMESLQEPKRPSFFGWEMEEARQNIAEICGKKFHGDTVINNIYKHLFDVDQMLSLPKAAREALKQRVDFSSLSILKRLESSDGTVKFLFEVQTPKGPQEIESVYLPDAERTTLCVSSQVGCKMGCKFCLTAQLGFRANLTADQIVRQVYSVMKDPQLKRITNIVFMGMGEPMDNFENVRKAIRILTNDKAFDLSHRKITVSTVGLVEKIDSIEKSEAFKLAVSLNASHNGVRSELMPVNQRWDIEALMAACRRYTQRTNKRITFEYILMEGLTDSPEDAERLIELLRDLRCKLNLIPYNESEFTEFKRPKEDRVLAFHKKILKADIPVFTRKNRGNDIYAACGMLKKLQPQLI